MPKLDRLWTFQTADMEVLKFENTMRRDPTRTKLLRLRDFVVEQTNAVAQLEADAEKSRARMEQMEANEKKLQAQVAEGMKKLEADSYETLSQVQAAIAEAQKVLEGHRNLEKELKKMIADAKAVEARLKDIRAKVAQAKQQYASLKEGYDKEYERQSEQLNVLKKTRAQCGEGIDEALLKRYEQVKQQCTPPLAKLNGDRCGGCNMSLPAAIVKRVRDETNIVECENCGRILLASE